MNWPQRKKFAVFLSHDIDRVQKQWFQNFYYFLKQKRFYHLLPKFKQNPYWTFKKIAALEQKYKVRSTFFFLNESIKLNLFEPVTWKLSLGRYSISERRIIQIIKDLERQGFEIGLHGSYRSFRNQALLAEEKQNLEKILGKKIYGVRQHYLNLDIPETWRLQDKVGFAYDASFGFENKTGFRGNRHQPFFPLKNNFLVIPLVIIEDNLFSEAGFNPEKVWQRCLQLINRAEINRGLLSLLWHNQFFNEKEFPGFLEIYEKIILECQKRNAWFGTGKEIYEATNAFKKENCGRCPCL